MNKLTLCAAAAIGIIAHAAFAQQCNTTFGQSYKASYMQNAMWPTQYVQPPRQSICATFSAIRDSGWRRQNMLGQYHFNDEGTELSQAGKTKVQWIATQAMPHRRQVFVQQEVSPEATAARVSTVQQFVANGYPMAGQPIVVNETPLQFEGRPASAVDTTMVGYQTNQPAPMLPAAGGSGSGSSSESGQ